jgi:hypothetical protein
MARGRNSSTTNDARKPNGIATEHPIEDRGVTDEHGESTAATTESTGDSSSGGSDATGGAAERINGIRAAEPRAATGRSGRPKRKYTKRAKRATAANTESSGPGRTKEKAVHLAGLEKLLLSLHAMGAMIASTPELEIDEKEAAHLAACSSEVLKHYAVVVSEKTAAWLDFLMCCGGLYGVRIATVHNRKKKERVEARPKLGPITAAAPASAGPVRAERQANGMPRPVVSPLMSELARHAGAAPADEFQQ